MSNKDIFKQTKRTQRLEQESLTMADITYCINSDCPFKKCDRHFCRLHNKSGKVSIADFSGTCREYIDYLVTKVELEESR